MAGDKDRFWAHDGRDLLPMHMAGTRFLPVFNHPVYWEVEEVSRTTTHIAKRLALRVGFAACDLGPQEEISA